MIDPSSDEELDAVLGGGRLSGPARDRVFDTVAATVAREPRRRVPRYVWSLAMVAAGAAAAVVVAPRLWPREGECLCAKGDQEPVTVQLDVVCSGGTLAACPQDATLTFGVSGGPADGVLSAYAEPVDAGLERVWYFSAEGESPRLTVGGGTEVARRAVRLGPEHLPGHYRVHLFLTRTPASAAVLLAGSARDQIASRQVDLTVSAPRDGVPRPPASP